MGNQKPFSVDGKNLTTAIQTLHQAAQFAAMISNSYLPKLNDDSQNSFHWNAEAFWLEGRWIKNPTVRFIIDIRNFEIIIDNYPSMEIISLDGWTKEQIIGNLQDELKKIHLNPALLKPVDQFTIPPHPVDKGLPFSKPSIELLMEWSNYLSVTQQVLEEIKPQFKWASAINVWPHHFDMGLYLPIAKDEAGNDTHSIGLGLAIPDAYIPEPYFYVNHWSMEPVKYPEDLPQTSYGYWNTKDWKGLVLTSSTILISADQVALVKAFFNEGINVSLQLLKRQAQPIA
jgi:hypothetical protein